MSTETITRPLPPAELPKQTEFTDAEHSMLDAMNVPTNRFGRALLFREMQRTGLDPFAKHLYLREDWNAKAERNVYAVASTIAGFEIVAKRQATYEGQTAPQWCDKNGKWFEVWVADAPPVAARIGVYVRGYREPMWGIARFTEYKPNGGAGFMWQKMAAHMIAKVAEALAIRKAYPDQLSGVYTDDEMQQADARSEDKGSGEKPPGRQQQRRSPRGNDEWNSVPPEAIADQQDRDAEEPQDRPLPPPAPGVPTVTGDDLAEIARLLKDKRGAYNGDRNRIISELVRRPVENVKTLSQAEARSIIETLTAEPDLIQLPDTPEPETAPDEPPGNAAGASGAQMRMMHALLRKGGHTKDGGYVLMSRVTGRTVTSANDLTPEEASAVIKALTTGEIPAAGPAPSDEGISEFDALFQVINDARTDEEFDQARAEIEREHAAGGIGGDQLAALQAHWVDARNERLAKAGASA